MTKVTTSNERILKNVFCLRLCSMSIYYFTVVCLFLYLLPCVVGLHHCHERFPDKKIDTAYLTIVKDVNTTVIIQLVTAECYKVSLVTCTHRSR